MPDDPLDPFYCHVFENTLPKEYHYRIVPEGKDLATASINDFKIKGKDFYGIYLSPSLKYSKNYGYITYKVTINPKKTSLIL